MNYKNTLPMLLCSLMLAFTIQVVSHAQGKVEKIDQLLQAYYELDHFNGTVLVAEHGELIFKKGYGLANMEWDIPNEPNTKMRLGSITKQFTSMLIMQLVEEGKIHLQDKITEYLPDYRSETGDKVSIHQLLTHTSGIPSYTSLPNFFREISRDPYSQDVFIEKFCSGDLEFEPGTRFKYNNSGYYLLGAIIEKVCGNTYEEALHQRILKPLGMKDTGYDHQSTILKNRATGYSKTPEAYAYGWSVGKVALENSTDSLTLNAHGGGINGFNTLITRVVDDQHLVVLLNNTGGTDLNSMDKGIRNILYDLPYELPDSDHANEM